MKIKWLDDLGWKNYTLFVLPWFFVISLTMANYIRAEQELSLEILQLERGFLKRKKNAVIRNQIKSKA